MTIDVGQASAPAFNNASPATTVGINTAATGSSFLIFVAYSATTMTVSDNKGNTANYVQVGSSLINFLGLAVDAAIYLCTNGTGGSGHTASATMTGGASIADIYLIEITGGALASLVDAISSAFWNDSTVSPYASNVAATAHAIDLLLGFTVTASVSGTESITWLNSFTQVSADGNSAQFTGGIAKRVVSSTGNYSVSFTSSGAGTTEAATALIALKDASGGIVTSQYLESANRPRPGRGPFSKGHFFVSDKTPYTSPAPSAPTFPPVPGILLIDQRNNPLLRM